ncbi:2-dehydropantoate 2-reductase [Idiomarina sp. A28L]|uniref:ketopantoate reductase family protein n=1 Tax=Idiomarina sp. A28L TaxID=1036674 RepID=UPI0002138D74|nr:2-dehydropantoate 2-reductase [Idiomarina sp. A28L]EGN74444.1 2-dehydropantoate 2-reductase [Idiomarina sp. A28L]
MANWVIVGTGALSALWAHGLHAAGANVQVYSHHEADNQRVALSVSQNFHQLSGQDKLHPDLHPELLPELLPKLQKCVNVQTVQFPVIHSPSEASANAVWLIMVKAWQLEPLLTELAAKGLRAATMVLSHNGMGAGDTILAANEQWQIFDLVTTHGAWRQSRTHSTHAGLGESWIGERALADKPIDNNPPLWFVELAQALPPLHWVDNILHRRWQKMAINCAINPLATLAGADNGILRADEYQPKIRAICEEIANINPELDADELVKQVHKVAAATATNKCSMLQDIQADRLTEIEFLNGFICREGERLHVATRSNCELWAQIQTLQR